MGQCDFCDTWHSSMSCHHPGRQKYDAALAEVERLKAENAELHVWREIGFALWHAASPDSDDEIGREALSRFLLAVDKQLETEAAAAAKGEADARRNT